MGSPGALSVLAIPVLTMLAALVWTVPGRPLRQVPRGPSTSRGPGRGQTEPDRPARRLGLRRAALLRRSSPLDLGAILTEVAARLQAGAPVDAAWSQALPTKASAPGTSERAGRRRQVGWVPPLDQGRRGLGISGIESSDPSGQAVGADGVPVGLRALRTPDRRRGRQEHLVLSHQVAGAEVACRVAHTLGTPLAGVLEACADGVSEAGRAQAARRSAVAAPRATARLLGWLPVAGLVLGSAWGADPLQVLFDGGWGTVSLVTGAALMGAGHLWANRLVRGAEQVGP